MIDWKQYNQQIVDKVRYWFAIVDCELIDPTIFLENIYNIDKTEAFFSTLDIIKIFIGKNNIKNYWETIINYILITAIKYISADK